VRKRERTKNFIFLIILIFSLFLVFINLKIFKERKEIEKKVQDLKKEIEDLSQRKKEIEEILSKTKSEIFWEEKAREQGFIKEGEEPIIIQFK
jgi:cell division protein FtsB